MEAPSRNTSTVALASLVPAKLRVVSDVISSPVVPVSSVMPVTAGSLMLVSIVNASPTETLELLPAISVARAVRV